jgi:hypothetical protein
VNRLRHLPVTALLILSGILASSLAYGGAWTQKRGNSQLILTGLYYGADQMWDASGRERDQTKYSKYELNPYYEYGLRDWVTLGANLSFPFAAQGEQSNAGIGDSEFFARFRLLARNGFVFSLQPLVKLPSPWSLRDAPVLSGDDYDVEMGASAGYGFTLFKLNHFVNLDAGYRYRFGTPQDQIKLAATAGFSVTPKWMILPQLFIAKSAKMPASSAFTQSSGDDYDLTKLQLSAVYRLNSRLSLQAGAFAHIDGKNTGGGNGAMISIWRNF